MKRVLLAVLTIVLLAAGVLMLFANSAFAQAVIAVAQLNGTVRDSTGSVVPNASVSLRNLDTNRTYTSTSDASGYYIVPNLPPGSYELNVTSTGFEPHVQSGIQLTVGQTATLDVTLAVQGRQDVVDVTVETPAIEPTRTELSNVIETKQIASLPISGRLFTDFALLTPGVTTGRTSVGSTITEFEVTPGFVCRDARPQQSGDGRRRRQHQYGDRFPTRHSGAGSRAGVPRREQQFWRGVRPGIGRHCEYRHEVRHQQLPRVRIRLFSEQRPECPIPSAARASTERRCARISLASRSAVPSRKTKRSSS